MDKLSTMRLQLKDFFASGITLGMDFRRKQLISLRETLKANERNIFDALRIYLQDSISAWREEQVAQKLIELAQELKVVATIKAEIK